MISSKCFREVPDWPGSSHVSSPEHWQWLWTLIGFPDLYSPLSQWPLTLMEGAGCCAHPEAAARYGVSPTKTERAENSEYQRDKLYSERKWATQNNYNNVQATLGVSWGPWWAPETTGTQECNLYSMCFHGKRPRAKQGWRRLEVAAVASQDEENRDWTAVVWRKHSLHKHVGESSDPQHQVYIAATYNHGTQEDRDRGSPENPGWPG